jgi:phospholipase D1/2
MLPLLPAFAGDVESGDCIFLRMILDWHYKTIKSLVKRIKNLGVDPEEYIKFLGLRTHGVNNEGTPSTEIVYVHSKLMIVDDTCTIIGSANINDRSLLGDRDSEIAVVTYGTDLV